MIPVYPERLPAMFKPLSLFSAVSFFFAALALHLLAFSSAAANEIMGIKAFQTKDYTRIVIETSEQPRYTYRASAGGLEYTVRITDIDNPAKKYGMATITRSSILNSVKRGSGKKEIFYVFGLKKTTSPIFNTYKGAGRSYNIIIEFPHNAAPKAAAPAARPAKPAAPAKPAPAAKGGSGGKAAPAKPAPAKPAPAKPADAQDSKIKSDNEALEAALFETLNEESDADASDEPAKSVEQILSNPEPPKPSRQTRKNQNTCIVVVDPGHGGKDPGAVGKSGLYEKNVTLGISKFMVEYLNGDKFLTGYLTRSTDRFIELGERSKIARAKKADMLISIHADSAQNRKARGASVLVLSKDRADRENDKINARDQTRLIGGAGDAINHMCGENKYLKDCSFVVDLASSSSMNYGFELANKLLTRLKMITRLHKRTPISRSLAVLKAPDIPSLLIETGYISNPDEEKLLRSDKYRRRVAYAIYQGVRDFVEANPSVCLNGGAQGGAQSSGKAGSSSGSLYYTVRKGDNLTVIARRHGVTVAGLKKLNGLKSGQVNVGQKLRIR